MKIKKCVPSVILGIVIILLIVPILALAQPLVYQTSSWIPGIAFIAGFIVIVVGGILYLAAGGNKKKVATAKITLIGGVIVVALSIVAFGFM